LANEADIDAVALSISDVNDVADSITDINQVQDSLADVGTAAGSITNINIVGNDLSEEWGYLEDNGLITDGVTGGTGISNITTVATNIDDC